MPSGSNFMSEANKVGTHGSCVRAPKPQRLNLNSVPELVEGPSFDYPEREQNHERSE